MDCPNEQKSMMPGRAEGGACRQILPPHITKYVMDYFCIVEEEGERKKFAPHRAEY